MAEELDPLAAQAELLSEALTRVRELRRLERPDGVTGGLPLPETGRALDVAARLAADRLKATKGLPDVLDAPDDELVRRLVSLPAEEFYPMVMAALGPPPREYEELPMSEEARRVRDEQDRRIAEKYSRRPRVIDMTPEPAEREGVRVHDVRALDPLVRLCSRCRQAPVAPLQRWCSPCKVAARRERRERGVNGENGT